MREVVYFLHPSSPREMPPGRHASHANLTDLPKLRPPPSAAINPRHFFSAGKCIDGSHMLPFTFGHGLMISENLLYLKNLMYVNA